MRVASGGPITPYRGIKNKLRIIFIISRVVPARYISIPDPGLTVGYPSIGVPVANTNNKQHAHETTQT